MTRVALFVTCLADQFWPSAAIAAAEVLRRVGCSVDFDARQTCCGQPAFNTGYRREARTLARRTIEIFESSAADAIVCPSGSCTAMLHHYEQLFDGSSPPLSVSFPLSGTERGSGGEAGTEGGNEGWHERARKLRARTYELSAFLVNVLGMEDVGASFRGRLTWHDACHGLRDLGIRDEPRRLLRHVRGVELVELPPQSAEACCGFGGTFSVKYPEISVAILDEKIDAIERTGVDAVVSGDASCLMQIGGRLSRRGSRVRPLHLAEILASHAS